MPVVTPPEQWSVFCGNEDEPGVSYGDRTVTVPAIPEMKYHQQDYWGSDVWETSWARRTYVEGAFGNLKNHHTGNIKRGFMTAHGIPLVSLALTAPSSRTTCANSSRGAAPRASTTRRTHS